LSWKPSFKRSSAVDARAKLVAKPLESLGNGVGGKPKPFTYVSGFKVFGVSKLDKELFAGIQPL
jgi:hypothetical protein